MIPPTDSDKWFVCPQPQNGAEARLFLFPYAGGGPASFSKWCLELPASIEGRVVHYPGRGSRHNEPLLTDLRLLVENLSRAILPLLNTPFVFFGHSLGGLVAFELARQLRRQNLPQPQALFISACGAPQLPDPHVPIHHLPDADFQRALKELNGIPTEILQNPDVLKLSLPILRADFAMVESYRHQMDAPLDSPIIALGGLDDPRVSRERLAGWANQTATRFESHYFPGDHFFITSAKVSILAKICSSLSNVTT